jgi:hypothetical protein
VYLIDYIPNNITKSYLSIKNPYRNMSDVLPIWM